MIFCRSTGLHIKQHKVSQKIPNLCIRQSIIAQHKGNRRNNGGPLATQAWRSSADNNWRLFCSLLCPGALWEFTKKKSAYTVAALPGFRQWTVTAKAQTHQTKPKPADCLAGLLWLLLTNTLNRLQPERITPSLPEPPTMLGVISACLLMSSWRQWGWAGNVRGFISTRTVQVKSAFMVESQRSRLWCSRCTVQPSSQDRKIVNKD